MINLLIKFVFYFFMMSAFFKGIYPIKFDKELNKRAKIENIDTIFAPKDIFKYNCNYDVKQYEKRYNYHISKFYIIGDENVLSNNDSLATLTPFYIEGLGDCYPKKIHKKLLIIQRKNIKNQNKTKIYNDVLYPDIHQEISKYKEGFAIEVYMSGVSGFRSDTYVNSQYCIDSIHIESWGNHQYEKTYKYKNFSLDKFTYHHIDNLREKNDKMDNIRRKKEGLLPIL